VIHTPQGLLPIVCFEEADFFRTIDARRWRSRERNTRVGFSPVQGRGSFAARPIRRGEPVMVRERARGNYPVNHSDMPNTARAANRAGLFALRDIAQGEEITEDYRFLPFFEQRIPELPEKLLPGTAEEYARLLQAHEFVLRRA
jgi:SET domain-containing protein